MKMDGMKLVQFTSQKFLVTEAKMFVIPWPASFFLILRL